MYSDHIPQSGDDLGSQPTMSRLENAVTRKYLLETGKQLVNTFIVFYTAEPKLVILDCDDTNSNTIGQQQLTLFNSYYHEYCYMPLHIYEGYLKNLLLRF